MQKRIYAKQNIVVMPSSFDDKVLFNKTKKKKIKVDENYKYNKNIFYKIWQFVLYYFIARPVFLIYGKVFLGIKVYGKEKIKNIKTGAITVSNHVHYVDFCIATHFVAGNRRSHIISNKENFDVPVAGKLLSGYGVMPLPDTTKAHINFYKQVNLYLKKKRFIHLFPEASMWPYYNKLRPFKSGAFHFACKNNLPVIPYVLVFRKSKGIGKLLRTRPRISVYVCDPIYPNSELKGKEQNLDILNKTHQAMQRVLDEHESFEYWHYITEEEYNEKYKNLIQK